MRRTAAPRVLALILCALLAPLARAQNEKLAVTDVAPLETFLVLSVADWPGAKAALLRSELGALWKEPDVRTFVDEFMKEMAEDRETGAGEVWDWFEKNVRLEDLREPAGGAGFAVFPEAKAAGGGDPEEGETHDLHVLAFADFGDDAGAMMTTLADIFERLRKDGHITLAEDDYEGTDIHVVTVVPKTEEEPGAEGEEMGEDGDDEPEPPQPLMFARSGRGIVATTSRRALEAAIDRAAGVGGAGGRAGNAQRLADNRTFTAAAGQHPAGSHLMVVGIASDYIRGQIKDGLEAGLSAFAPPGGGEALLNALGVGAVEAFGVAVRLDTEAGTAEQSLGILAPRKAGLLTLMDSRLDAFTPPAYIPADAMSAYSIAVRFDRIPELIRSTIKALPPEMQAQFGGVEAMIDAQIAPLFNAMGSELHILQVVPRPFEPGEQAPLIAIRLKDPLFVANFINGFAPQMGLTARVFEGNQIFQREDDDSFAIGIGFDHFFTGSAEGVENAFRLASRPDAPRLAASDRFRRAAGALGDGGVFYSYTNTAETLEYTYWQLQNAEKIQEAQLLEWGFDDEMRKEFLDDFREQQPKWAAKLPPIHTVLRHLGDSVTEVRPTPDGFRGRTIFLRP